MPRIPNLRCARNSFVTNAGKHDHSRVAPAQAMIREGDDKRRGSSHPSMPNERARLCRRKSVPMSKWHFTADRGCGVFGELTLAQKRTLERAVAKVVLLGHRTGVSVDDMIELLMSGMTVCQLLDYLAARTAIRD